MIPVCNQYKIRAACHPHDPGTPPEGFQGIINVLGTVEGLKRFVTIQESPYHGLNFCVGTVAEMLPDPAPEICEVVRYFGSAARFSTSTSATSAGIATIFARRIPTMAISTCWRWPARCRGRLSLHADARPHAEPCRRPRADRRAFAFGYGYIKGLLQAIASS